MVVEWGAAGATKVGFNDGEEMDLRFVACQ